MSREYKKIKQHKEEIYQMKEEGLTYREIGEKLGYTRDQVKYFVKRQRQRQKKAIGKEISLKHRGRPRKNPITNQKEMEEEINRLKMENELLRDFLQSIGRR